MGVGEAAVKKLTWHLRWGCHSSPSPPSPSPALKRVRYPFIAGWAESFWNIQCTSCVLNPGPSAPVMSTLSTRPQCLSWSMNWHLSLLFIWPRLIDLHVFLMNKKSQMLYLPFVLSPFPIKLTLLTIQSTTKKYSVNDSIMGDHNNSSLRSTGQSVTQSWGRDHNNSSLRSTGQSVGESLEDSYTFKSQLTTQSLGENLIPKPEPMV